jgi:hypothetical protein
MFKFKKKSHEAAKENTEIKEHKKLGFKQKLIALIIGLAGVFLLVFIIIFTVSRVFRPEDLANFLPKDSVIGLVQVHVGADSDQVGHFYSAMNNYEIYNQENVIKLVNEMLDADFKTGIKPWLGRQIGFVFLEKKGSPGEVDTLIFAEVSDKTKALEFMKSRGLKNQEDYVLNDDYQGISIYRYALSQTFNFSFINNYLVIASKPDSLKQVIDVLKGKSPKLKDNPLYQKVAQNIPITNIVFSYVDLIKTTDLMKSNSGFMSEKGRDLLAFEPFLKLYKGFGATLLMENGNIAVQTYSSLNDSYLNGKEFLTYDNKYRGNLLKYMPQDLVFYAGGINLNKQIQRYSELFSAGGEVSYLIFEGLINAQKNTYFGNEVSLEEDIYPLLQGEYGFGVAKTNSEQALVIALELDDPIRDKDKIAILADSFANKNAILSPVIVEKTLEDGTVTKEIQTTPEEISKSTEDYRGYEINALNISNQSWGVYYLILDKTLIISSKKETMHAIIDLNADTKGSYATTQEYTGSMLPVINVSDEIIYFNFDYFNEIFKDLISADFKPYLLPIKSISSGNNYFKDGISSVNYLKID